MKEILLRLIALQTVLGELCDLAREDEEQVARDVLNLEPRLNKTINETFKLLGQLPINEAPSISIFQT